MVSLMPDILILGIWSFHVLFHMHFHLLEKDFFVIIVAIWKKSVCLILDTHSEEIKGPLYGSEDLNQHSRKKHWNPQ